MQQLTVGVLFALLLGLGLTAFWLQNQVLIEPLLTESTIPVLNESMHSVTAFRFDASGNKIQTIKMDRWFQYAKDPNIFMEFPIVEVQNPDGTDWYLKANKGLGKETTVKGQFDVISLIDNVDILQRKDGVIQLELETQQLNYQPKTKEVATHFPVHIKNDNLNMHATGMKANITDKQITFLGRVNSTYVP